MHHDAIAHLKAADPRLAPIIELVGACGFVARAEGTHFDALCRAIVYQQLSGKAAATIHGRVLDLFGGRAPLPAELLATPAERLRACGLSRQKMSYILDLAERVERGDVPLDHLDALPDDEIVDALVRVKGIGRWTAQMFLMFRLGRLDVLPELDLGVQKGLQRAYGKRRTPRPAEVRELGAKWAPYRSIASWYLWRLLDADGPAANYRPTPSSSRSAAGSKRSSKKRASSSPERSSSRRASPKRPSGTRSRAPRAR
jgi:DNA-3-methyladenine glycosylase II